MNTDVMTTENAVRDYVFDIEKFNSEHGEDATIQAITAGAWHRHPEVGKIKESFIHRDVKTEIPRWISDMFLEYSPFN